jgi:hypothetical protein
MDLGRSVGVGLAVFSLAVMATGCDGAADANAGADPTRPVATPTVIGTGSPSGTTTASATGTSGGRLDVPAEARANTAAGAEAFVRFYFERLNVAFVEANPAALTGLSAQTCGSCASFAASVRRLRAKEQRVTLEPFRIMGMSETPASGSAKRIFSVVLVHVPTTIISGSGALITREPQERMLLDAALMRAPGGWAIAGLSETTLRPPS